MKTNDNGTADALFESVRRETDAVLERWAASLLAVVPPPIGPAVGYALVSSGKRVRPALVTAAYEASGGSNPGIAGIAAAVEVVHTYSLVHDDLPCMDDDDQRRGRPTVHRKFSVEAATWAGYTLVPVAAQMLAEAADGMDMTPSRLGDLARVLFQASGLHGMVGGQWRDLKAEGKRLDISQLRQVHAEKTGALIRASCLLGGLAANASREDLCALNQFGTGIGLAFQVADDLLDATGTSAELGKTPGRDVTLHKSTFVSLLGVDGSAQEANRLATKALSHFDSWGSRARPLRVLGRYIVNRRS